MLPENYKPLPAKGAHVHIVKAPNPFQGLKQIGVANFKSDSEQAANIVADRLAEENGAIKVALPFGDHVRYYG